MGFAMAVRSSSVVRSSSSASSFTFNYCTDMFCLSFYFSVLFVVALSFKVLELLVTLLLQGCVYSSRANE